MNNEQDGGPAFPEHRFEDHEGNPSFTDSDGRAIRMDVTGGMTLRDWMAGQALAGILANPVISPVQSLLPFEREQRAEAAYEYADAMLEARKTPPAPNRSS